MAISIETTVFVNETKALDFGWVLKCAHPHRYKTEEGDWSTASTTYIDIIVKNANLEEFKELTQVTSVTRETVSGYGKPVSFMKKDGTPGTTLQMEPIAYEIMESNGPKVTEEAPF
jgi:hypothetical protein